MADCCNPSGYRHLFNQREARRNLKQYDKRGLDPMARSMVAYLAGRGLRKRSILEIGGGIGALHVELLKAGAEEATNVELSGGYEAVADELLERENLVGRVNRRLGDFTEVGRDLEADDVVMNRVVCCYPNMERLMTRALASSKRFVAATFPRDRFAGRASTAAFNAWCRIRNVDFKSFVHSNAAIEATARESGFNTVHDDHDLVWRAMVFERG